MATMEFMHPGNALHFDGSNYAYWKIRMIIYIKVMGPNLWRIVDAGFATPIDPQNPTQREEQNLQLDAQALNALYSVLSVEEFNRVSNLENAHDVWTTLMEIHEGTSTVKETNLHKLKLKYESFTMLPHESINEMYSRMNNIVNELKGLSCDLTDLDIVRKILRALPDKYETLVTLFLNSSELPRMTPTALLGNLITNKMYKKDKDELKDMASTSS